MQVLRKGRTHFATPVSRPLDPYSTPLASVGELDSGGMMGCRVVLLIEAGSPRLSLSDGHTSMESAPPGCSSLLVPCEDAGLLGGGWLLGTVNEGPRKSCRFSEKEGRILRRPFRGRFDPYSTPLASVGELDSVILVLSYEVPPGEIATPHVPKEQPQSTVQNKTTAGLLMESSNCFVEHMSPPPVSMATPPLRPTLSQGNNGQTLPYAGLQVMVMNMPLQMQPSQQMSHAMGL
ncbi:hypothetical protein MTO96_037510 [Rhipicephalus appendiculatus]